MANTNKNTKHQSNETRHNNVCIQGLLNSLVWTDIVWRGYSTIEGLQTM